MSTRPKPKTPEPSLSDLVGVAHRRGSRLVEALVAITERAERVEAENVHLRATLAGRQSKSVA